MTVSNVVLNGTLAIAAAFAMAAPGFASAASLAPHRATYEVSPAPGFAHKDAQVLDGLIVFELSDDCEGHTLTDRTVIVLGRGNGYSITLDSQYSAWESKDGRTFRFINNLRLDGREIEAIRGSASLDESGGEGEAHFVLPEEKTIDLPSGTRFPVGAGIHTLGRIEAGERQLSYVLFDGSSVDGPYFATDFVVTKSFEEPDVQDEANLLDTPSWRIRTAVFDLDDETAPPATEIEGQTHSNGVISHFVLETGSFAALATLMKVEALPESGC